MEPIKATLGAGHALAVALYIVTLVVAVAWEVRDDRDGDVEWYDRLKDLLFRALWWSASICYAEFYFGKPLLPSAAMVAASFVLFFDYLMAYYLIKRRIVYGHWFSYLSKKKWTDQIQAHFNPWVRLLLKIVVFACAVMWFVVS